METFVVFRFRRDELSTSSIFSSHYNDWVPAFLADLRA